jgi:hypothetical protein
MLKTVTIMMLAVSLTGTAAAEQTTVEQKAAATIAKVEQSRPPEPPALPVNIRIEVSITDQTASGTPARKVVSMIASDRSNTNIRSSASVPVKQMGSNNYSYRNVTINVDARPIIVQKEPNKISLSLGLEYFPKGATGQEEMEAGMASFSERLALILESGKPLVVSQAADPTSDRKISVEVTATILK